MENWSCTFLTLHALFWHDFIDLVKTFSYTRQYFIHFVDEARQNKIWVNFIFWNLIHLDETYKTQYVRLLSNLISSVSTFTSYPTKAFGQHQKISMPNQLRKESAKWPRLHAWIWDKSLSLDVRTCGSEALCHVKNILFWKPCEE